MSTNQIRSFLGWTSITQNLNNNTLNLICDSLIPLIYLNQIIFSQLQVDALNTGNYFLAILKASIISVRIRALYFG